jgi:DNA-directed RNA polymerase specialized sigma24 family protein
MSVAADAITPAGFMTHGAARTEQSADWAVTELYSRHFRALVRTAVLLVGDVPTAEDVVQDSFAALHDGWHRLKDQDKALAYLRQAVVNRSRSVLRHRTVVDKYPQKAAPDMPSAERQREAIVLRYYADLSEAQIARAMGISCGAVKSHTARGMAALRAALEP